MHQVFKVVPSEELAPGTHLAADEDGRVREWRRGDVCVGRTPTVGEAVGWGLGAPDPGYSHMVYFTDYVVADEGDAHAAV